ncbi:radical SAM additional 4Fe4S-binding SPASM domain-containing protein [Saccharicrinis carchari]|uniref:Radical SAM additional 4Fe4S-binding SPASM domain-containing protein n=1 Tax=Saccharicrinis carchari TaxID=1168039 RepID=A0A521BUQ4_SACCC|nr:radical SAM/SPASM domain-containing protein [Saccharicrinis carchari]SMO50886.1 radical SAM additional 4Fe4S-binding SPASM domain-containing protein [Saccharicrinis carchari]
MISLLLKKPCVWGQPLALSVEPINICNLKCPECPTGMGILTRPKGMLTVDSLRNMLKGTAKSLWHLNIYFQGEPYMHPDFFELVTTAKKAELVVETSTNAQFLNYRQAQKTIQSGLDVIVVSMDGSTQGVYEKYRVGGDIEKVIKGIENLVKAKKEARSRYPLIRLQFLAFSYNQHQIKEMKQIAFNLGVDSLEIKKAQIYGVNNKTALLPTQKKLSRYAVQRDGEVQLQGKVRNSCWKHWSSAVVTWRGDVVPCCFDKDAKYVMGNANQQNLKEIWYKTEFKYFRRRVLQAQQDIDICSNCPLSRK